METTKSETMSNLVKHAHAALTSVAFVLLTACASLQPGVTDVMVGKDFVKVLGTTVQTPDELIKLLTAEKIRKVILRVEPELGYEKIGKVIYSVSRAGVEIESVDVPPRDK